MFQDIIINLKTIRKPFYKKFNKRDFTRTNEQIRVPEVRVIDENGKNLGILKTYQAIQIAQERGLDLVEVSSKTQPSICKIIEYGKYQYLKEKKEKKTKQKKSELKGIRIGFATSVHDLETKAKQSEKFLKKGHKVRIEMRLRGREKAHKDIAKEKLDKFLEMIPLVIKKEEETKKNPKGIAVTICQSQEKQTNQ